MFRSRSHPDSPPPASSRHVESNSMLSQKRDSHSVLNSHFDSLESDACRRGKRRRRDDFSSAASEKCPILSTCENRLQKNHDSTFATTSAQFNLFSRPPTTTGKGRRTPASDTKAQHERQHGYLADLVRLRSSAFWELRKSISENGEGLVRRMRDYEHSRSRHQIHHKAKEAEKRDRKKLHSRKKKIFVNTSDASEDEDILISSGESANHILRGTFLRTPKDPTDDAMDVDTHHSAWPSVHHPRNTAPCSVQDTHYTSSSSLLESDDGSVAPSMSEEVVDLYPSSPTGSLQSQAPSLSHSTAQSPCSSFLSLPLPSSSICDEEESLSISSVPSLASDKAIAALNLALANGAGSINDYSPVNTYEEMFLVEHYDHGDLWN